MRRVIRRLAHWLAPALAVTFLVAGCGGGNDSAATGAAATVSDATAPEAAAQEQRTDAEAEPEATREGGGSDTSDRADGDEPDPARESGERDDSPPSRRGGSGDDSPESGRDSGGTGPAASGRRREIESFLEGYVARYSRRDASVCTEVFTQRHVEALTGRKGDAAVSKCRSDVSRNSTRFRLHELGSVQELSARRWRAVATLAVGNRAYRSVLELVENGDGLRIDAAG